MKFGHCAHGILFDPELEASRPPIGIAAPTPGVRIDVAFP